MTKEQLDIEAARRIVHGFLAVALAGRTPEDTRMTERVLLSRLGGYKITPQKKLELTGEHTRGLLSLARKGDQSAHDSLLMIAEDLTDRSKRLPLPLQEYITNDAPRFRPRKGRPRGDWIECAAIAAAVTVLTDFHGFNLTRNRASADAGKTESACSIVAAELGKRRILKEEAAVEKIANKYKMLGIRYFIRPRKYKEVIGITP